MRICQREVGFNAGGGYVTVDEMKNFCNELGLEKVTVRGENIMFCCPYLSR